MTGVAVYTALFVTKLKSMKDIDLWEKYRNCKKIKQDKKIITKKLMIVKTSSWCQKFSFFLAINGMHNLVPPEQGQQL